LFSHWAQGQKKERGKGLATDRRGLGEKGMLSPRKRPMVDNNKRRGGGMKRYLSQSNSHYKPGKFQQRALSSIVNTGRGVEKKGVSSENWGPVSYQEEEEGRGL